MRVFVWSLLGISTICACGAEATPKAAAPALTLAPKRAPVEASAGRINAPSSSDSAPAAAALDPAEEADQHFVVNARRAIGEYRLFIEKAGSNSEFAEAVRRSQERIADLEQRIEFVENGRRARDAGP